MASWFEEVGAFAITAPAWYWLDETDISLKLCSSTLNWLVQPQWVLRSQSLRWRCPQISCSFPFPSDDKVTSIPGHQDLPDHLHLQQAIRRLRKA